MSLTAAATSVAGPALADEAAAVSVPTIDIDAAVGVAAEIIRVRDHFSCTLQHLQRRKRGQSLPLRNCAMRSMLWDPCSLNVYALSPRRAPLPRIQTAGG